MLLRRLAKARLGNHIHDSHIYSPAATRELMISARSAGERWQNGRTRRSPNLCTRKNTALQHNLTLVTRNTKDVAATDVAVFNPWTSWT